MNKKLRKLLRSPRLFFKDMLIKRQARSGMTLAPAGGQTCAHRFSVVSAVYNVGRYLDKYFETLTSQRVGFKECMQLVMVDDGSTDNSAQVIQRWQRRFPDNIVYIHKENGGQASARNLGIQQAAHEWVTFIDPDDFVNPDYFQEVARFIDKHASTDLQMIGCHQIFYIEKTDQFRDNHPLRYKFANGDKVFPISNLGNNIQLSAATAVFRKSVILNHALEFDARVKPNFEDGLFIAQYLAACPSGSAGFVKNAVYYYRKREDGTSTLDTSWQHPGRLGAVLEHGYLGAFAAFDTHEKIPVHIQRTVLYDIVWIIRHLMDRPQRHAFLTPEQRTRGLELLREVCARIDVDTIMQFELAGCWFMHKLAILASLKGVAPPFQVAYVEAVDEVKDQVLLTVYTGASPPVLSYRWKQVDTLPDHLKAVEHRLLDEVFVTAWRCWLPIGGDAETLSVRLDGIDARISLGGKLHSKPVPAAELRKHFRSRTPRRRSVPRYTDCWLLMDRNTHADDNAEHLYRHIARTHPGRNIFFVLDRESFDWDRLAAEGFRLIAFGSAEHRLAATCASKVISSHADAYVMDFLGKARPVDQQFVFLQHGVIMNDLSVWLNPKDISCFVTSAKREYQSISGDGSYNFSAKETALTGLPRHDRLRELADSRTPTDILVMPTWRNALMAAPTGDSARRTLVEDAEQSLYFTSWTSLLASPRLQALAERTGGQVVFFPHANMQSVLDQVRLPDHVVVKSHEGTSIQELFASAAVLITDYSSVAFEVALIERPVIYFQFDEQEFFEQQNTYTRGYFDYRQDGFGPVVTTEEDVLSACTGIIESRDSWWQDYGPRIESFFAFRDTDNCARVVRAIEALDEPRPPEHMNDELLHDLARSAFDLGDAPLATTRYLRLLESAPDVSLQDIERCIALLLSQLPAWQQQADHTRCAQSIGVVRRRAAEVGLPLPDDLLRSEAAAASDLKQWGLAAELWTQRLADDPDAPYAIADALRHQGWLNEAYALLQRDGVRPPLSAREYQLAVDLAIGAGDWRQAADSLMGMVFDYENVKSSASIERALKLYETHAANAHLTIAQTVDLWVSRASQDSTAIYLIAAVLHRQGKHEMGYATLGSRLVRAPVSQEEWQLLADLAMANEDWGAAADALRVLAVRYSGTCPPNTLDKALDLYQRCQTQAQTPDSCPDTATTGPTIPEPRSSGRPRPQDRPPRKSRRQPA